MAAFSPLHKLSPNPSMKLRASQLNEQNGATVKLTPTRCSEASTQHNYHHLPSRLLSNQSQQPGTRSNHKNITTQHTSATVDNLSFCRLVWTMQELRENHGERSIILCYQHENGAMDIATHSRASTSCPDNITLWGIFSLLTPPSPLVKLSQSHLVRVFTSSINTRRWRHCRIIPESNIG